MVNHVEKILFEMYQVLKDAEEPSEICLFSTLFLGGVYLAYASSLVNESVYNLYCDFISEQCKRVKKCSGREISQTSPKNN